MDVKNQKFKEVIRKSRAGIVYVSYEPVEVKNPIGYNHSAKRRLAAQYKRVADGREYYVIANNYRKIYFKNENPEKN